LHRHPGIQLLRTETHVRGKVFDVRTESIRLPSGREQRLQVIDHPGAVAIAPVLSNGDLLLVRQYRHPVGDWILELPAGRIDPGEDPAGAAARELEEETGHRAARWRALLEFLPAPGISSERITIFRADDLEAVQGGGLASDPDEELELVRRSPASLLAGESIDAKTLIAAMLLACGEGVLKVGATDR
jgi:ADP-ribose pyrophosphatase